MSEIPTSAHFLLHFGVGLTCATLALLPRLTRTLFSHQPCANTVGRWILASYGLGLFAAFPNLLSAIGLPHSVIHGWWMNLFLLHPLIDRFHPGGQLLGQLMVAAAFCLHYALILIGLHRASQGRSSPATS